jgi:hypothetical protein
MLIPVILIGVFGALSSTNSSEMCLLILIIRILWAGSGNEKKYYKYYE